jgi:voltage-gated potassium channel
MDDKSDADRLYLWESRAEWPLAIGALLFLAAYAWPVLDPGLPSGWHDTCDLVNLAVWVAFGVDYAVRLSLAPRRWDYFWRHLVDLGIIALPVLRPLRLLRLVILLKVLNRRAADSLRGRLSVYVPGATMLLVFCAALAVLNAERGRPGATIDTFGEAVWWAITTISTVGYGDQVPVTVTGRFVAAGLMVGGVALLSVVTASIASWLLDRVREVEETAQTATRADVAALTAEVRELKALLAARASVEPSAAGDGG